MPKPSFLLQTVVWCLVYTWRCMPLGVQVGLRCMLLLCTIVRGHSLLHFCFLFERGMKQQDGLRCHRPTLQPTRPPTHPATHPIHLRDTEYSKVWCALSVLLYLVLCVLILRGTTLTRAYGRPKNLYKSLFLPTIFGPIYYGPP